MTSTRLLPIFTIAALALAGGSGCGQVAHPGESGADAAPADSTVVDGAVDVIADDLPETSPSCTDLPGVWSRAFDAGTALRDVVATARDDAWVLAGDAVFHWDGATWKKIPKKAGRNPRGGGTFWATGPTDVWVADFTHWDGVTWSEWPAIDTFPANPADTTGLWGTASTDMWVHHFEYGAGGGDIDILIHWDGSKWTRRGMWFEDGVWGRSIAHTLHASGADNIWAIDQSLPERWNGSDLIAMPRSPFDSSNSLWVGAENDVWTAGESASPTGYHDYGLAHYDGKIWIVDSYRPTLVTLRTWTMANLMWGTSKDLWAIGDGLSHWDGTRWCRVEGPSSPDGFVGINGSGPLDVWAISPSGAVFHYGPR